MKLVAYATVGGTIGFGPRTPHGHLTLAVSEEGDRLREIVEVIARHGYDGETLLVPGLPEAQHLGDALEAWGRFCRNLQHRLSGGEGWVQ